jgi:hypothetical protein
MIQCSYSVRVRVRVRVRVQGFRKRNWEIRSSFGQDLGVSGAWEGERGRGKGKGKGKGRKLSVS